MEQLDPFAAQLAEGVRHVVAGAREMRLGAALIASAVLGRLVDLGVDRSLIALGRLAARAGPLKRWGVG